MIVGLAAAVSHTQSVAMLARFGKLPTCCAKLPTCRVANLRAVAFWSRGQCLAAIKHEFEEAGYELLLQGQRAAKDVAVGSHASARLRIQRRPTASFEGILNSRRQRSLFSASAPVSDPRSRSAANRRYA